MAVSPHSAARIAEYFHERSHEILETVDRLVRLESPSGNAGAVSSFVGSYRALLEQIGLECEEIPGKHGPFLRGSMHGTGGPPLAIVGHSDTVWPLGEVARRPPFERAGCYHGPGAYDMKAGLTVAIFALRFLQETRCECARPLEVLLSPDEELGSETAHPHMERLLPPEATALVLEPPLDDGSLKTWRKGVGMYRLEVRGREAHAGGEPGEGVNAIVELAERILEVVSWSDSSRGIAVSVGEVRGGIATNVIPGQAEAGVDTRFERAEDGLELDRRLRALKPRDARAAISLSGGIIFPPLLPDARSGKLAELATSVASELGLRISSGKCGGGSDGSFLAARGLAVLDGLGVEGGGAHSRDEHIMIDRLPVRAAFLARLLIALGA